MMQKSSSQKFILVVGKNDPKDFGLGVVRLFGPNILLEVGLVPIHVWPSQGQNHIEKILSLCGGILLIGGNDPQAKLYGETPHEKSEAPDPFRDEIEIWLIHKAFKKKIPVLGLCRGAEMLWVATGGKICQHIPDVLQFKDEVHQQEKPSYEQLFQIAPTKVDLVWNSNLAKIFQNYEEVHWPCMHHQCVMGENQKMLVCARSKSGVPEAVEAKDPSHFAVGIQGHIEAFATKNLGSGEREMAKTLFAAFAKSVLTHPV